MWVSPESEVWIGHRFLIERLMESFISGRMTSEDLRSHLQLSHVLKGLYDLCKMLFGVTVKVSGHLIGILQSLIELCSTDGHLPFLSGCNFWGWSLEQWSYVSQVIRRDQWVIFNFASAKSCPYCCTLTLLVRFFFAIIDTHVGSFFLDPYFRPGKILVSAALESGISEYSIWCPEPAWNWMYSLSATLKGSSGILKMYVKVVPASEHHW